MWSSIAVKYSEKSLLVRTLIIAGIHQGLTLMPTWFLFYVNVQRSFTSAFIQSYADECTFQDSFQVTPNNWNGRYTDIQRSWSWSHFLLHTCSASKEPPINAFSSQANPQSSKSLINPLFLLPCFYIWCIKYYVLNLRSLGSSENGPS